MTQQQELRRLVGELDSPLADLGGGIKILWELSEACSNRSDDADDALAFLAKTLQDTLDKIHDAHSGLYRVLRQDSQSDEPTPLHSA